MGRRRRTPQQYPTLQHWRRAVRKEIVERDGNACFYCNYHFNQDYPPTIEHLLAVSAGGSDNAANLVLACEICNKKAGSWPLIKKIKFREYKHNAKI